MYQSGLIKKVRLISNFMTSQPSKQTVQYTYCPISQEKKVIECNIRKIFLEKSSTKCGGETSFRPFSEKVKLRISLGQ